MATTILTDRQRDELHKSIVAYLSQAGLSKTAAAFRDEADAEKSLLSDEICKKYEGLLEKKWTSVVRLQKKIMELESRAQSLQNELDQATPASLAQRRTDPASWLPRGPSRHTLLGHRDSVNAIAFHPVFSVLASASLDSTIKIWDWEHGELEQTIKGHTKAVTDIDFGGPKSGILLASCSHDLTIKLWDPGNEYKCIRTLSGHDHSVSAVRFIPSASGGNYLISASRDKTLKIWEVSTGYSVKTLQGHADWVRSVEPSIDGQWLLSAGNDQTARLWDATSNEHKATFIGHSHVIECAVFAPTSTYAYISAMAGYKKPASSASLNEFVATGSRDKTIKIWDSRGSLIKSLTGHDNWIRALAFHPGGKYLLSCSDDKTIRCWDLEQEGRCVKVIDNAHAHFLTCLKWAPSAQTHGSLTSEVTNGAESPRPNGQPSTPVKKKPDSKETLTIRCVIATGSVDQSIKVWQ